MSEYYPGTVSLSRAGRVATVLIDRARKLNSLTPEMLLRLEAVLDEVEEDRSVRVVVLRTAPSSVFCAGADINLFGAVKPMEMWSSWTRLGHRVFDHLAELRQPTVAAVSGSAYGGGLEIALACDLRVCADDAELGMSEVTLGTIPGWGGTARLPAAIGIPRATQMILTGKAIAASTALAWGLVTALAPPDKVYESAVALAEQVAAQAPIATQMAKQAIRNPASGAFEQAASAALAHSGDALEGRLAFRERRAPEFTGT